MTMWISPVTECQTILDFAAAREGVSGDSCNYETCADHIHLAPAKSSPPAANVLHRPDSHPSRQAANSVRALMATDNAAMHYMYFLRLIHAHY